LELEGGSARKLWKPHLSQGKSQLQRLRKKGKGKYGKGKGTGEDKKARRQQKGNFS